MEKYKYSAFISYRHTSPDADVAKKLHTLIENFPIPAEIKKSSGIKKMGRVFRDQDELPLTTNLGQDIREALDNSQWLIVICSPRYLESHWCKAELDYFIQLGKRDHILTLLVEGEPGEAFPAQLRYREENGRLVEVEPLAADVRAGSMSASLKKLKEEKLRILAPMLDVNYDQLRQRARRRRARMAAAVITAGFVALSGFLSYALIKNNQITKQNQLITEQNREITEQRNLAQSNELQVIIEQASISAKNGDKLIAAELLTRAAELRETVGQGSDRELKSVLEASVYTSPFETILNIDNDNRKFHSMVFSHNDRYLLGATNRNSATLIDADTGKILYSVARSNIGTLDSVGFTKDDQYFYTVDTWFNYVNLYRVETGEEYHCFHYESDATWQIGEKVFPMEDHRILIVLEHSLVLWDYETDTTRGIRPGGEGSHESLIRPFLIDLSPDESRVVIGSLGYGYAIDRMNQGAAKVLTLDGESMVALEGSEGKVCWPIMFSGDGQSVAGNSGTVCYVWEADTGALKCTVNIEGGFFGTQSILINYDGSVLIIMDSYFLAAVDVATGRTLWRKENDSNISTEAAISPNGKYVCATGGIRGVFDIRTGEALSERGASRFSNDGTKLISDTYSMSPVLLVTPEAASAGIEARFSEELFTTARYTDPPVNVNVTLNHDSGVYGSDETMRAGRKSLAYISPDVKYLAYTHYDGFIEVYDISDTDNIQEIFCLAEHYAYAVEDLIFNDGLMASCGGYDPRCMVFDLNKGSILHVLAGEEYAHSCEFSQDGSKLIMLCGYSRDRAFVYDTATGNLLYVFSAPEGVGITEIGFTRDGSKAVARLADGRAIVGGLYAEIEDMIQAARSIFTGDAQ